METTVLDWLSSVGSTAFKWSALAFLAVNGAAIAAVVITKDRSLVNRWTGRLLAANLVLVGTGVGIPMLTAASRFTISLFTPVSSSLLPAVDAEAPAEPLIPGSRNP
jgi:hypothetical protein